jgi:hypothetical protein
VLSEREDAGLLSMDQADVVVYGTGPRINYADLVNG